MPFIFFARAYRPCYFQGFDASANADAVVVVVVVVAVAVVVCCLIVDEVPRSTEGSYPCSKLGLRSVENRQIEGVRL
jgi:hypothetical protein